MSPEQEVIAMRPLISAAMLFLVLAIVACAPAAEEAVVEETPSVEAETETLATTLEQNREAQPSHPRPEGTREATHTANDGTVVISGTLVNEDGSPVTYGYITICPREGDDCRIVAEGGILLNPRCKLDDEGRFNLKLDPNAFGEVDGFMVLADLDLMSTSLGEPVVDENGFPLLLSFSGTGGEYDLGRITVP